MTSVAPNGAVAPSRSPSPGAGRTLAVLSVALAVFFLPALVSSDQFLFRDNGRMHAPAKRLIAEEFRHGHLPQWNPYAGVGVPIVGCAVDAVQHPFNVLLVLFPFEIAFKLWVLLSYLLAATGAFAWARRLGCGWHAAIAAGLAFALSGHLVSSSDNVQYLTALAALPWLFAAADAFVRNGGPGRLALVGCGSGLAAAAGDPQSWALGVAALVPYALFVAGEGRPARLRVRRAAGAVLAAAMGAAPFVLPILAWLPHSSRAEPLDPSEYLRWNLHPVRLLELVVPNLLRPSRPGFETTVFRVYAGNASTAHPWVLSVYAGASVALLAAFALRRSRAAALLAFGGVLGAWMAMGPYLGFGQLARHVPGLSGFRYWEKAAIWPALLWAMAAGLGIDLLLRERSAARRFSAVAALAGGAALLAAAAVAVARGPLARLAERPGEAEAARLLVANLAEGLAHAGLVGLLLALAAVAAARELRTAPMLLALVVAIEVGAANSRAYVLSPASLEHPDSPLARQLRSEPGLPRVVTPFELRHDRWPDLTPLDSASLWGARTLSPGWSVGYRIGNFDPYTSMPTRRVLRVLRGTSPGQRALAAGLWGFGDIVEPAGAEPAAAAVLDRLPATAVDPELPAVVRRGPARRRAYLAGELTAVDEAGAERFALDSRSAAGDLTVVEGRVPSGYAPPRGQARIAADDPERVMVEVSADGPALLVLNDAYAAGWRATVDGKPAEILPANYLVRGVWVPAGAHRVEFTYRTPGLRQGWAVFAGGALALAGWAALARRRARSAARPAT